MSQLPDLSARPYRSHKVRACDLCRKRKSRCTLDIPGKGCMMCRVAGTDCYYEKNEAIKPQSKRARIQKRQPDRTQSAESRPAFPPRTRDNQSEEHLESLIDGEFELTHFVGPIMADDAKVVEQHCTPKDKASQEGTRYKIYSNDSGETILYTKVSRSHPGLQSKAAAGEQQRIIMEQILGHCAEELINIYFDKIHPSFPILDARSLQNTKNQHTIMCEVYSISLLYWNASNVLRKHPQPDAQYFWNLAVSALQEEFLSPGLFTIRCALIDLAGRPSLWLTGNVINSGRTVALAHSLGLNRNPRKWKINKEEQDLRIRVWWGIVIHDRWASFAHGVPPNITRANYDVLLPSLDDLKLVYASSELGFQSAEVFICLCSLSEVLGDILPLIYDLSNMSPQKNIDKQLRRLEVDLDNWEDSLPWWLQQSHRKPLKPAISGSSGLQLSYLVVRLLIRRMRLHKATVSGLTDHIDYYRSECRDGALEIVDYILALESAHLQEFWLPYNAYHLSSTATLLLRCAIETEDSNIKETCLSRVKNLIDHLEKAKNEDDWDIGSVCLAHCKATISRMTMSQSATREHATPATEFLSFGEFNIDDTEDFTLVPRLGDEIVDDSGFDIGDVWDNFCSTLDYT